jgi:hypothetical protein
MIHGDAFRHDPRFLHQSNGFPASWQTIKIRAVKTGKSFKFNPYLTHIINIHLKTICYVIKNLRVALRLEK